MQPPLNQGKSLHKVLFRICFEKIIIHSIIKLKVRLLLTRVCQIESAKPHKPAMTKKMTGSEGLGRHCNMVIIKATFSKAANTKMGTRPKTLTADPKEMHPTASQTP